MEEKEKKQKKSTNDAEKNGIKNKDDKMTLGDELLEKEFERQKIAKKLVAKEKLGKNQSN